MLFRKKRKIIELEEENKNLRDLRDKLDEEKEYYKKRLRRAGNADYVYFDSEAVKAYKTEIKGVTYGNYIATGDNVDDEIINSIKEKVAKQLVDALIENELVQFIIKKPEDFGPPNQFCTVAAKLRVVPWEQMTVMMLHKNVEQ